MSGAVVAVKINKRHPDAQIPQYASVGAACFDLHYVGDPQDVMHDEPILAATGLSFEIPPGYVMLLFSRSGHGFNSNVRLGNCVGVIDSDYRGELMIKLIRDHASGKPLSIRQGDRIAQAMLLPFPQVSFLEIDTLSATERGIGGFGSTGV